MSKNLVLESLKNLRKLQLWKLYISRIKDSSPRYTKIILKILENI